MTPDPWNLPNTGGGGAAGPFDDDTCYCNGCGEQFDAEGCKDPNAELCDDCFVGGDEED